MGHRSLLWKWQLGRRLARRPKQVLGKYDHMKYNKKLTQILAFSGWTQDKLPDDNVCKK